jgi:hypothetical protein
MEAIVKIFKEDKNDFIFFLTLEEFTNSVDKFDKIEFKDILDTIVPEKLMEFLFNAKSKLNQNGRIIIQGYDLYELAYAIVNDRLPTIEFNNLIKNKRQILCVSDVVSILDHLKFKVVGKDVDAMRFLVEAENV